MPDNHFRLLSFIVNVCCKPLRKLFLKYMRSDPARAATCSTVDAYLRSKKAQLQPLRGKSIPICQWNVLFPPDQVTDESSWNITLVTKLLLTLFSTRLQPLEKDAIQMIRSIYNQLCHTTMIDNGNFKSMWASLENAAVTLEMQINPLSTYADTTLKGTYDKNTYSLQKHGHALRSSNEKAIIKKLNVDMEKVKAILIDIIRNTERNISKFHDILGEYTAKKPGKSFTRHI